MSKALQKAGLVKQGIKPGGSNTVTIGGADETTVSAKEEKINAIVTEAMERAKGKTIEIVEKANAEAKDIVEQAKKDAIQIEQDAYEKGYSDGKDEAINRTNEEMSHLLIEAGKLIESIEKERQECLEDEEIRIYHFIIQIAHKLLKRDLRLEQEPCLDFIKAAINKLENKSTVNIFVNEEMANKVHELKPKLIEANPGLENISVTADTNIEHGDLILESTRERLDFRLDTQLEELENEILNQANHEPLSIECNEQEPSEEE